jgi:hypothetical protein
MELSGQLHALAALLPGNLSSVNMRLGEVPYSLWMLWRIERCHSKLGVEPEFCGNLSHSVDYILTELPCDNLLKDLCLLM